jgi:WS/DGAT/MGAT family acyltransferase
MTEIDLIRDHLDGTVNDVLTNAVAGGLRRYLEQRGELRSRLNVRAIVPVSLRPLEEMNSLGNQFGLVFLSLPVGIGDTRQRLVEIRKRMGKLKRSFEPVVAMQIMAALGASPKKIQDLVVRIFGTKGTAVLTNVPGPRQRLYFAGKPMRSFMFWVPQSARLGMGLSILSYAGEVRVGVATDAGLVPDPEALVAGMHKEFSAMLRLADELARRTS